MIVASQEERRMIVGSQRVRRMIVGSFDGVDDSWVPGWEEKESGVPGREGDDSWVLRRD